MQFSILTLNLWNINEPLEARYSALARGLKSLCPDIFCLQEVSRDPRSGLSQAELVAKIGNFPYSVEKDGLSILCRYPIVRSKSAALPEFPGDGPRHVLLAEILINCRAVLVTNTHLAHRSEMIPERKAQAEAVLAVIKNYRSTHDVRTQMLCGDFNDVSDSPAIRVVLDSGEEFHDTYVNWQLDSPGFTYSRQNPYVDSASTIDQRIDYIFASCDLVTESCRVVFDGSHSCDFVSDHFGVFCNLVFQEDAFRRLADAQNKCNA